VVIWILWATCEISIVALDLTMLLGGCAVIRVRRHSLSMLLHARPTLLGWNPTVLQGGCAVIHGRLTCRAGLESPAVCGQSFWQREPSMPPDILTKSACSTRPDILAKRACSMRPDILAKRACSMRSILVHGLLRAPALSRQTVCFTHSSQPCAVG